jgi:LysM repeat protein
VYIVLVENREGFIMTDKNLKHIRQMGSPTAENQVYIENSAYARVHEEDYAVQCAFIFMGHTECQDGSYTTFVEAAIPVRDLVFTQNIPNWNTHVWSDVFREIKRSYENSIIVGWALDCKGFAPHMTPALEAVHSEHFGGAHQVLLLMDTLEGEEYFFQNHGNHLCQKQGFYIYYMNELRHVSTPEVRVEIPPREKVQQAPKKKSFAVVAAVAAIVIVLGLGAVWGQVSFPKLGQAVQDVMGNAEWLVGTEQEEYETEKTTETLDLVPVETKNSKITEELQTESETQEATETMSKPETYTVRLGDTLIGISKKIYGSESMVNEIAELNHIENTDEIHEGQKLLLP